MIRMIFLYSQDYGIIFDMINIKKKLKLSLKFKLSFQKAKFFDKKN